MSVAPPHNRSGALAIIAALPRELALLARDLGAAPVSHVDGVQLRSASLGSGPVLLATAGMGAQRVSLAVAAALAHGPVDMLLSVGLAGACEPLLAPGSILEASVVIDARSGERFTPETPLGIESTGILVTTPNIAGPAEKQRLHATYTAAAVDMEAATVARLARGHDIAFAALKAISDVHDVDLTALSRFADRRGHFRTRAFALHTALRPHRWRDTMMLGSHSNAALVSLTRVIRQILVQRETEGSS